MNLSGPPPAYIGLMTSGPGRRIDLVEAEVPSQRTNHDVLDGNVRVDDVNVCSRILTA